jgi:hypothetical protein
LKWAFDLGGKPQEWVEDFRWLFGLRVRALHSKEEWQELVPHEEIPDVESRDYSARSAEWAVALARDVIQTCIENPKPETEDKWLALRRNATTNVLAARE